MSTLNRAGRRALENNGASKSQAMQKYRQDIFNTGYQHGYAQAKLDAEEILYYMFAYTFQYKFSLTKEQLQDALTGTIQNIESYATGQLTKQDFDDIRNKIRSEFDADIEKVYREKDKKGE